MQATPAIAAIGAVTTRSGIARAPGLSERICGRGLGTGPHTH